jgi:glycosyltransferase involved in cell wall biosynthesis
MKIIIIEPIGAYGGMMLYDFSLCSSLVNAGVIPLLFTSNETPDQKKGDFLVVRNFKGVYGKANKVLRAARFLIALVRSLVMGRFAGAKIAHFHFYHTTTIEYLQVCMAKMLGLHVVLTYHDVESFSGGSKASMAQRIINCADSIIAHSKIAQRELACKFELSDRKLHLIRHGNHVSWLPPLPSKIESRRILGIPSSAKILLFFGQIKNVKGLDILLRAMPLIHAHVKGVQLVVAGRPWQTKWHNYEKQAESLGISDIIDARIGYVPEELVAHYFNATDAVVIPYRKIYQSGNVLMGMSYGKPVIVSDIPGMLEMIEDEVTGFVFRDGNAKDCADVVVRVLSNLQMSDKVGQRGKQFVCEKYDWNVIGQQTAGLYSALACGISVDKGLS